MDIEDQINSTNPENPINSPPKSCTSPAELYSIATALTLLFVREFNQPQLETLVNLLGLIQAGIGAVVTQMQICEGEVIQPPIL